MRQLREVVERLTAENLALQRTLASTDLGRSLQRQQRDFSRLLEVSERCVAELNLSKVFDLVASAAREVVDAELVVVPMLDADLKSYSYVAATGSDAELVRGQTFEAHVGMCGWVLRHGKALLFGETSTDWNGVWTRWEEGQASAVLVPLIGRTGIIGGLSALGKKGGGCFTQHDLDLLSLLANQASIAIQNARLFQQWSRELDERKQGEARLLQFLERMPVGVMVVTAEGKLFYLNPVAEELLGQSAELELDVSRLAPTYHAFLAGTDEHYPLSRLPVARALQGETETVSDMEIRRPDGRVLLEVVGAPIYGEGRAVRFAIAAFVDISEKRKSAVERERLIADLQKALAEIKTLRGIMPICSYCKKIKDDQGAWTQMELYIRNHSEAEFSHGMCPECVTKYFPDDP